MTSVGNKGKLHILLESVRIRMMEVGVKQVKTEKKHLENQGDARDFIFYYYEPEGQIASEDKIDAFE